MIKLFNLYIYIAFWEISQFICILGTVIEVIISKKNIMKKTIILTLSLIFSATLFAQQGSYQDLLIFRADGDWDKLIKKSEQYTLSNKTKKDAEPYYYLAYGLYKISYEADRDDKYKNAYKDAFNAVGKMLRYDKSGDIQSKYSEFLGELKLSLLELIENDLDSEEYRRAFGWTMRLYKFGRDYTPAYFLEAALRHRNDDKSTARIKWETGDKLLAEEDLSTWPESDKRILMVGIYQTAQVLTENLQADKAKSYMNLIAPYMEDIEEWSDLYDDIVN